MKIIFLGSPQYATYPLEHLLSSSAYEVLGVVSQPPKKTGRGRKLLDPPVATYAKEKGLLILQPEKASADNFLQTLKELAPDICITCAYGKILTEKFLSIPTRATINIHPSKLPEYRGATPVQSALLAGKTKTAISILFTVKALDAGNIISQEDKEIHQEETAAELLPRLFKESCTLLIDSLNLLKDKKFIGHKQNETQITHCTKITKEQGQIDWNKKTNKILNCYKAYRIWPGSYTFYKDKRIVLTDIKAISNNEITANITSGEFLYSKSLACLYIKTADGYLGIYSLKPEGRKQISAQDFWNSLGLKELTPQKFNFLN